MILYLHGLLYKALLPSLLDITISKALAFSSIQSTLLTFGSKCFKPSLSFSVGLSPKTSSTLSDSRSPSPAQAMVPRPMYRRVLGWRLRKDLCASQQELWGPLIQGVEWAKSNGDVLPEEHREVVSVRHFGRQEETSRLAKRVILVECTRLFEKIVFVIGSEE